MNDLADPASATGGCLCGGVTYELRGPLRPVMNCHCGQCRRTHGHFAAYTSVPRAHLTLTEARGLRWYESSDAARRGFCAECGASLFWGPRGSGRIAVAAGTLDAPTGLTSAAHVFVADKGDYYEITDDLETYPGSMTRR